MKGKIKLEKVSLDDAEQLWRMQRTAFSELLEKYQDTDTNPACETLERVREKAAQPDSSFYWIKSGEDLVGGIRVVFRKGESKRISPLFILPQYRNKGIAQQAIRLAEELYGDEDWELGTILQEKGNCHLYEKMGYRPTGGILEINDKMTLIFYKK
ncbi:MAG: GNAT family N-acetyltransferase [Oscillospiraceae bacterium]|nr:GNAT family N-acetyltransferase [Oscillospiraceae bacterium]